MHRDLLDLDHSAAEIDHGSVPFPGRHFELRQPAVYSLEARGDRRSSFIIVRACRAPCVAFENAKPLLQPGKDLGFTFGSMACGESVA